MPPMNRKQDPRHLPSYLEGLNNKQMEAVLHEGSPLLILAGAGSGKTRVITTKIAYLVDKKGIDPRSILAVTFTNKAAREMEERVRHITEASAGVMVRTFHSFGAWFLRRNAALAGLKEGFTIYDEDDSLALLSLIEKGLTKKELAPYCKAIARSKDSCLDPDSPVLPSSLPRFAEVYGQYEKRLREIGNVDFGDLLVRPLEVLRSNREILDRISSRFSFILVDEYQDSNTAQFNLLKLLAARGAYICVVGDDDQSIYRFRGAEVGNILSFPENFPGTEIIRLEQNYRSTPEILSVASSVVAKNTQRLGKTLWTDLPAGKKTEVVRCSDQEEEARFCAELLHRGNPGATAILYRTNAQSLPFETLFTKLGIPFQLVGAVRFYDREEIKDALALLSLVLNRRDAVAFKRMANKPARGIGKSAMDKILARAETFGEDLLEAAEKCSGELTGKGKQGVSDFSGVIKEADETVDSMALSEFLNKIIRSSGLYDYHSHNDEISAVQRLSNLSELVNSAVSYGGGRQGLVEFMEAITLDRSSRTEGLPGDERVTLITMHNTKGLEFERVIITGLEEGIFPSGEEREIDDLEEERRLFYVSVTRAMRELYLTTCGRRLRWGRIISLHPSRFLREIPKELIISPPLFQENCFDEDYSLGGGVFYEPYGCGIIIDKVYNNNHLMLVVRFESGRIARLMPEYQSLERISLDD